MNLGQIGIQRRDAKNARVPVAEYPKPQRVKSACTNCGIEYSATGTPRVTEIRDDTFLGRHKLLVLVPRFPAQYNLKFRREHLSHGGTVFHGK